MQDGPTDTEIAWAAGFYDGEGCATHAGDHGRYLSLQVGQKDRRPLDRFAAIVGGNVCGPYESQKGMHCWQRVVEMLWPYLSEPKREQVHRTWGRIVTVREELGE